MADLAHIWGGDLALGQSGDLATSEGPQGGTERVLRRLLTNRGAYLWHLRYGAGLARYVGTPTAAATIEAVARQQLFLDGAVSREPAPAIDISSDGAGSLFLQIRYADAATAQPRVLATAITAVNPGVP